MYGDGCCGGGSYSDVGVGCGMGWWCCEWMCRSDFVQENGMRNNKERG